MFAGKDKREAELEDFWNRWKKEVFTFCRMFLADGGLAEKATCVALVTFTRQGDVPGHSVSIPPDLMRCALQTAQEIADGSPPSQGTMSRLDRAVQRLPRIQRAIVIMRRLHMDWEGMALATGLSARAAREVWVCGVIRLAELLRHDFSKEHSS